MDVKTEDIKRNTVRVFYLLKRLSDDWYCTELCHSDLKGFNNSHLPLFMGIGTKGISNANLAAGLGITKQAASKIIKELEDLNLVISVKSAHDGRSMMISLTENGVRFYNHISAQMDHLELEYKKVVGAKNYDIAMEVMLKLINYHRTLSLNDIDN
jgi:DNA-binding MarR family transcriptional regulator